MARDGTARAVGLLALAVYLAGRFLPVAAGLDRAGQSVLAVALCGMALWTSEAVSLGVTALIVLVLLGTVPGLAAAVERVFRRRRRLALRPRDARPDPRRRVCSHDSLLAPGRPCAWPPTDEAGSYIAS